MTAPCSVCGDPYIRVPDDPSPAHPSCDPVDPARFEVSGVRRYTGSMRAIFDSGCRGCGGWIKAGDAQSLAEVAGRKAWVCADCAKRSSPESVHTVGSVAPAPVRPDDRTEPLSAPARQRDGTDTSDRRAAA